MESILKTLYNYLFESSEKEHPHTPTYHKICHELSNDEQYFATKMSVDDVQRFEKYGDTLFELNEIDNEHYFSYGFSLGVLMMSEVNEKTLKLMKE